MEKVITNGLGAALAVLLSKYFREKYGITFTADEQTALAAVLFSAFVVGEAVVRGIFASARCLVDRFFPPRVADAPQPREVNAP